MAGYIPKITPIDVDKDYLRRLKLYGGFDPETNTITPIDMLRSQEASDGLSSGTWYVLDTFTLGIEAGLIDNQNFGEVLQGDHLSAFCEALVDLDCCWVNDRHFHAMCQLTGYEEEGMLTYPMMAETLENEFEALL